MSSDFLILFVRTNNLWKTVGQVSDGRLEISLYVLPLYLKLVRMPVIGLFQIGQGTYSNVYKARDRDTGKIVALKMVKFDISEPESVKFMAREITLLQKLDHPNVVKLEGLATCRMQYSLYLVFDFMASDLLRVVCRPDISLTEPQVGSIFVPVTSSFIDQKCFFS